MPRYYFDVRRNGVTERDPDGLDLPNATAARAEAKATAVIEMVKDFLPDEQPNSGSGSATRAGEFFSRSTLSC